MKFKVYYLYVAYEVGMFFYEMKKRNATSIKLEFQESAGNFTVYIDDSVFKTISGKLGWQIIKTLYSTASKKAVSTFNKDKSFESEAEITQEEFKKGFKAKLLPLTKGRCLTYSYQKKKGGIYEASISVNSDSVIDYLQEQIDEVNEMLKNGDLVYFDYKEKGLLEVENIINRNGKLKFYLVENIDDTIVYNVPLDLLERKKDINLLFNKVVNKTEVSTELEKENINNDEVSW